MDYVGANTFCINMLLLKEKNIFNFKDSNDMIKSLDYI